MRINFAESILHEAIDLLCYIRLDPTRTNEMNKEKNDHHDFHINETIFVYGGGPDLGRNHTN